MQVDKTLLPFVPIDADIFRCSANFNYSNARERAVKPGIIGGKIRLALSSDQPFLSPVNNAGSGATLQHPSSDQFHTLWLIK
ncbi:MAG: hypothetical protein NTV50_02840 [Planctomycetota bacterium]|nr:hypothetical protein [Planctomycetota bacterium]